MLTLEPFSEDQGRSAVHHSLVRVSRRVEWEPTGGARARRCEARRGACCRTTIKAAASPRAPFHLYLAVLVRHRSRPYLALGGIYRPIGAAFPNNPTRRQRLRGATGSHGGLSPSLAPLSRNLGPRVIRLTWGRVEDFGSSRAFGRSDRRFASEFTTACQGAPGILSSDFVQQRATCPRPEGLGRNLRSKTRWFTGFCNSHQVSHFAPFFIDHEPRYPLPRVVLDFTLQHCFRTNTVSGLAKAGCLVECSLTLFVPGFGDIRKLCVQSNRNWAGDERITTESVTTMILPQDWVICAPAAFLGCGSRFSGSLSESNPNSPSPVTTMDQPGSIHKSRQALVMFRKHMERGTGEDLAVIFCRRQACLAGQNFLSHRHNLSATEIPANSLFTLANNA
ncbi:hypothetical protein Bca4012_102497 [Brassica carinata]